MDFGAPETFNFISIRTAPGKKIDSVKIRIKPSERAPFNLILERNVPDFPGVGIDLELGPQSAQIVKLEFSSEHHQIDIQSIQIFKYKAPGAPDGQDIQ